MESNEVYNVGHVRDVLAELFGIKPGTWLYHSGRMPGPDLEISGWPFYSSAQFDILKAYWLRQSSVKRYMRLKAAEQVA